MTINKYWMPALVIFLLLGTVGIASLTGNWAVSGKMAIAAGGLTNTNDIKGWMTIQQVIDGFAIDRAEFYKRLSIPESIPAETAMKDLEALVPGFETSVAREVVKAMMAEKGGASPAPTATAAPAATVLPTAATTVAAPTAAHTPSATGGAGPTLQPGQVLSGADVKGSHTLEQIAQQAQVPLADLLKALKLPDDTDTKARITTLVDTGKITEVQVVRDAVTALQKR
jgi:hypothetical protein